MSKAKNGQLTVDKGIALPAARKSCIYPWEDMQIGDSFLVPLVRGENKLKLHRKMSANASIRGRRKNEKYATRAVEDGVRVWRVK